MHRGLCSSRLDPVNEKTWNQAIGTLSNKKKKKRSPAPSRMTVSPEAAHIQEGQVQACTWITVWERMDALNYLQNPFALRSLSKCISTVPANFFLSPFCLTLITNKHKCCHDVQTMKAYPLIWYQIFISFSLECTYMQALHENFRINQHLLWTKKKVCI